MKGNKMWSYLESRRRSLCAGKLVAWNDKRFYGYRYFWMNSRTGEIYELRPRYVDSYRHMWEGFSCTTQYHIRAGHVVPNDLYYLPF